MKKITLVNFRDLGGLPTPYGAIREGKLYRTAAFRPKNQADRRLIEEMRLDSVVDLRTARERKEKPDRLPAGVEYVPASVFSDEVENAIAPSKKTAIRMFHMPEEDFTDFERLVAESYREMPFSTSYGEIFNRMDEGKTLAFHCTAGKDRTGIGAILIELALGCSLEDCKREYLASNDFRQAENERTMRYLRLIGVKKYAREHILNLLQTDASLFDAAIDAILSDYSSIDEFLEKAHGITASRKELWRSHYLKNGD